MSERIIELVRRAWEASARGDMPAMLECLDPNVEAVPFGAAMQGRVYRGHAGVAEWFERDITTDWEVFDPRPEEFHVFGERLVVFGHWRARGRHSGVELEVSATWIIDVRDDKIVRWQTYTDRSEALEAAGLSEQDVRARAS
jgi:ketosteroid isomerase-like protein